MFHGSGLEVLNPHRRTHPDSADDTDTGKNCPSDQYSGEDLPAIQTSGTIDNRQCYR